MRWTSRARLVRPRPAGNVYVATGNGDFNAAKGGRDFGDSVLKLRLEGPSLVVKDYFTPFNQKIMDSKDWDLGSQGPVLLGPQAGAHPHLLVVAGKEGKLYLLDRDRLGRFQEGEDRQIVESIKAKDAYGAAAYWNGHVFFTDRSDITRDFAIENGLLAEQGVTAKMPSPAATPIVSADGTKDGILWVVSTKEWNETHMDRPAVLHAYDATNISHELYNSEENSVRDRAGDDGSVCDTYDCGWAGVYWGSGAVGCLWLVGPTGARGEVRARKITTDGVNKTDKGTDFWGKGKSKYGDSGCARMTAVGWCSGVAQSKSRSLRDDNSRVCGS